MSDLFKHPVTGQIQTGSSQPVIDWLTSRGYNPVITPDEAGQLQGRALQDALKAAGLPRTGTVDEQRAALAKNAEATLQPHDSETVPDGLEPPVPSQDQ